MECKNILEDLYDSLIIDLEKSNELKFTKNQRIEYNLMLIEEIINFKGERRDLLEKYLSIFLNIFEIYALKYSKKETISFLDSRKHWFIEEQNSNIELINNSLKQIQIDLLNYSLNNKIFSMKPIANSFSLIFNYYLKSSKE